MVLLDDVVQIRCCAATTAATQFTGLLQLGDGAGVGRMPVHVDHSGRGLPPDHASRRNNVAAIRSRLGDNMNSIVSPAESTKALPEKCDHRKYSQPVNKDTLCF